MATAEIIKTWSDYENAFIALRVDEGEYEEPDKVEYVEYIGSVPLEQLRGLTAPEQQKLLLDAVKLVRDIQRNRTFDLGMTGSVSI